ncbi:predicted protein [Phaeodactylum tricornutum CCAP 1055/1]|uniref:GPI inositol-deacylase n=1 Tax=Phaeodactylum tricornutum (strain CCAP 1055/1) TaxID=556484 RepID=B5Y494_PHATC|nr:predicted protein [Phaeodactylum tricornutum CCAP 1055/1]ACI65268.1 predicted protein [Phaeodactylum tricornutum CCAP 1055/1]|eukprot:XP_002185798.1 predicted protein [Phaeodactylum tricornutum CCAP 1055/1]
MSGTAPNLSTGVSTSDNERRRISSNDPGKDEVGVQDTITFFTTDITALNTLGASIWTYLARAAGKLQATIRIASFLFMGYGFFLSQTLLFTSEECGMTYSWRRFLELDISSIHPVGRSPYRLYKFYDQRDPRHERFLQQESVTTSRKASTDWCLNAAFPTAVVYIPGHGGSYQQSRSLGAHGIQLTRQRDVTQNYVVQALQKGMWHGNATQLENFVYDVYALDFAEEGGGMHGDFLVDQSRFVSKAIHFLSEACGFSSITVVAHSIGGISIRLALVRDEKLRLLVTNVILLGSPQARTVLAWDPSLEKIQTEIVENHVNGTAFVAISGGLRDEMIPPAACELVPKDNNTLTLLAVDIMPKEASSPSFGMDHRAIVWCHNVLVPLRKIIFALVRSERDGEAAPARIGAVQSLFDRSKTQNYNTALQRMMTTFRKVHGPVASLAMVTGLLHNAELLLGLFAYISLWSKAGFASCFNSHFGVFSGRNPSYFVVDSTSVISTEADDVPKQRDKLALGVSIVHVIFGVVRLLRPNDFAIEMSNSINIALIASIYPLALRRIHKFAQKVGSSRFSFIDLDLLTIVVVPFLGAGEFAYVLSKGSVQRSTLPMLAAPFLIRLVLTSSDPSIPPHSSRKRYISDVIRTLQVCILLVVGPRVLQTGSGLAYSFNLPLGGLVGMMMWTDTLWSLTISGLG